MEGMGGTAAASGDAGGEALAGEAQNGHGDGGFDAVLAEFAGMAESHEEMRQQLAGLPEQLQAQQGFGGDPSAFYDDLGADDGPGLDAGLDPGNQFDDPEGTAREVADGLGQFIGDQIQQAVAPIQQQHDDLKFSHDVAQLVSDYPEMADPETATAVWRAVATYRAGHRPAGARLQRRAGATGLSRRPCARGGGARAGR